MSASVKAYFALKMIGDGSMPRTWRVRAPGSWQGGAANSNVFTRNLLALYGGCRGARCR